MKKRKQGNHDQDILSVQELADRLNIGSGLAYRALAAGKLPAIRLGRKYIIPRVSLERFLASANTRGE